MPYGALDHLPLHSGMADAGFGAAIDLDGTPADKFTFTVLAPMVVIGLNAVVTEAVANTSVQAQISLDYRPNYGSDTGREELCVISFPTGTAVGKVMWKRFAPRVLKPGTQLVVKHKTQGTGGTTSGACQPAVLWDAAPEMPGNCTQMIASA